MLVNYDWYIVPVLNPDGYEYTVSFKDVHPQSIYIVSNLWNVTKVSKFMHRKIRESICTSNKELGHYGHLPSLISLCCPHVKKEKKKNTQKKHLKF